MATKTAKKTDLNKRIDQVKEVAKDVNNFVMETSEELVEGAISGASQWQGVAAKAIDGGLKLAETQQEIFFSTLESLKGQFNTGRKRFKTIFSKN